MVTVAPIDAAFKQGWPEAQTVNLLDESLYADVPQDAYQKVVRRLKRLTDANLAMQETKDG